MLRCILPLSCFGFSQFVTTEHYQLKCPQTLVVDEEVSNGKTVLSGVSQGSVLGSIVFLYIIDLEEGLASKILKFADDTELFLEKLREMVIKIIKV